MSRVKEGGGIVVGVWELPHKAMGALLEAVPVPLSLGRLRFVDGSEMAGVPANGVAGAEDLSGYGGSRAPRVRSNPAENGRGHLIGWAGRVELAGVKLHGGQSGQLSDGAGHVALAPLPGGPIVLVVVDALPKDRLGYHEDGVVHGVPERP